MALGMATVFALNFLQKYHIRVQQMQDRAANVKADEVLPKGRLIAVAQARGGVGATTVAVNLANDLVGRSRFLRKVTPKAVALVDLDDIDDVVNSELVSEAVCPGAIQVTRDGQCIILGVDGQTIGGYPKIATVISADLPRPMLGRHSWSFLRQRWPE